MASYYDDPLDEFFGAPSEIAATEKAIAARGAKPWETPDQTEERYQGVHELKADDFNQRGIPSWRDKTGEVRPVTDESGSALSGFDKPSSIAYDSQGNPKKIGSDPPRLTLRRKKLRVA